MHESIKKQDQYTQKSINERQNQSMQENINEKNQFTQEFINEKQDQNIIKKQSQIIQKVEHKILIPIENFKKPNNDKVPKDAIILPSIKLLESIVKSTIFYMLTNYKSELKKLKNIEKIKLNKKFKDLIKDQIIEEKKNYKYDIEFLKTYNGLETLPKCFTNNTARVSQNHEFP